MIEALSLINLLGLKASDRLLRDLIKLYLKFYHRSKKHDHIAYLFCIILVNLLTGNKHE